MGLNPLDFFPIPTCVECFFFLSMVPIFQVVFYHILSMDPVWTVCKKGKHCVGILFLLVICHRNDIAQERNTKHLYLFYDISLYSFYISLYFYDSSMLFVKGMVLYRREILNICIFNMICIWISMIILWHFFKISMIFLWNLLIFLYISIIFVTGMILRRRKIPNICIFSIPPMVSICNFLLSSFNCYWIMTCYLKFNSIFNFCIWQKLSTLSVKHRNNYRFIVLYFPTGSWEVHLQTFN